MTAGSVIAIHSTISEQTATDVAAHAVEHGVALVDAPVTVVGSAPPRAGSPSWSVATAAAYERCKPMFAAWAELVLHVGPIGAGTRAKAARALLTFTQYVVAAESQRLAEAAGIDLRKLAAVVRQSDAITGGPSAVMIRETTAPIASDDPLRPIFEHMVRLGDKDLALALELGERLGVELPFARLAADRLAASMGIGSATDARPTCDGRCDGDRGGGGQRVRARLTPSSAASRSARRGGRRRCDAERRAGRHDAVRSDDHGTGPVGTGPVATGPGAPGAGQPVGPGRRRKAVRVRSRL